MTARERILAALNHHEPDRVPIDLSGHRSSGIMAVAYARLRDFLGLPKRLIRVYDPIQQLAIVDEDVLQEIWPTICATWSSGWIPFKELPKEAQELMHKWKNHVSAATKIAGRADWWEALDW